MGAGTKTCPYGKTEIVSIEKAAKMLRKITTGIRAAVVLIVAEDVTALRALLKSTTNLVSKSIAKHQNAIWQDKKKP